MNLLRAVCALAAPALLLGGLATPPAAAAETSTGVRCTIVGTAGDDLLVGTSARDVICGRGGDDVIRSGAGNDLVDAGDGSDVVRAGDGADRVLAGPGPDDVFGGTGADDLTGGRGADDLSGDGGSDELEGGYGDDDLEGGGSGDELDGQGGDDHLDGEGGGDDLDGGVGTNMCIVDAADESIRCRYDEAPPVLVEARIAPAVVDVTDAPAEVTLRVRATDDTGVDDVQVQLYGGADYNLYLDVPEPLRLESGTARDGWWATTFEVPRYTSPAVFRPEVMLRDRLGRSVSDPSSPARLEVLDANPDTTTPRLELLAPLDSEPVDVRTKGADVTVSVRGADDLSGVGRVDLCLARLMDFGYSADICQEAVPRTTGTARDGTWTATLRIPKGAPSGVWNVYTHAWDRVWNDVRWLGPDAYRSWVESRACCGPAHPFADDAGALTVIGAEDRTAAWTDSVVVTPTQVDTYQSDATTHVTVRARDVAGEGVTSVMAILVSESDLATAPQFPRVDLVRTAGDLEDGTWEGDLLLPQGTPPGRYHVAALVNDITHSTWFVGPSYRGESTGYQRLDHDPVVVVEDTQPPAG